MDTTYCNTCTFYWCDGRDIGCTKKRYAQPAFSTPNGWKCPDYLNFTKSEETFRKVLYTLKGNKVMVKKEPDGVYIRLADPDDKKGISSPDWALVVKFN